MQVQGEKNVIWILAGQISLKLQSKCKCSIVIQLRIKKTPIKIKKVAKILPCGGGHDAASAINGHPAAAAALWGVMVHAKIVTQLMC